MEKPGIRETTHLFALLIISTVTLGAISGFVHNSGTAAYINTILTLVLSLALVWVINPAFKESDFRGVLSAVYGKGGSALIMCALFLLTVGNAALRTGMFANAINSYILTGTPRIIILGVISICAFFASYFGLEAVTRYSLVTLIAFFVFFAIILFSSSAEVKLLNLYPLLGKGSFIDVLSMMYVFSDIIYLYLLSGRIKVKRVARGAIALGGAVAVLLTFFYVLCVPYPVSENHAYPLYTLASLSNSSVVFQRMDGLVFIIWILSSFISVGALCLFSAEILRQAFSLSDRRAVSSLVAFLVFLVSAADFLRWEIVFIAMSLACFVFLPVTAVIYRIMRRKKDA